MILVSTMVPGGGIEPPWNCFRRILSPLPRSGKFSPCCVQSNLRRTAGEVLCSSVRVGEVCSSIGIRPFLHVCSTLIRSRLISQRDIDDLSRSESPLQKQIPQDAWDTQMCAPCERDSPNRFRSTRSVGRQAGIPFRNRYRPWLDDTGAPMGAGKNSCGTPKSRAR
jgi:hypothetical protein